MLRATGCASPLFHLHKRFNQFSLVVGDIVKFNANAEHTLPQDSADDFQLLGIVRQGEGKFDLLTCGKGFAGFNKCSSRADIEHEAFILVPFNFVIGTEHARLAVMAAQGDLGFFQANGLEGILL